MSNGQMTAKGYRPEVRTSYHSPTMTAGQIVDGEWRPIEYQRADFGIPVGYFDKQLAEHGLLGLAQAEAIRWWFLANAEAERALGSICLETRLQEYELHTTYTVKPVAPIRALDCRGNAPPDPAAIEKDEQK